MIDYDTFTTIRNEMFPDRKFHNKQTEFFDYALNQINSDRDTDRITVLSARCGLGKSTFLQVLVQCWLKQNAERGLIIVTDNLERLSEFNSSDNRIAYLTAENKATEIKRQVYCPVLLMSTQRFSQCDNLDMFLTYQEHGKKLKRDTIIFDEAPYLYRTDRLGIDELDIVHAALNGGISDLCNPVDKGWLLEQYDLFREYLINKIISLEWQRPKTTYLYWRDPERDSISENDTKFFDIIKKYMPEINPKYPTVKRILEDMLYVMKNGCIFKSFKLNDGNDYSKGFIVFRDLHERYLLGDGVKTFIFDATAKMSEQYPFYASWLTMLDCDQFNVPLDWMHIHLIDVNTTRNALLMKSDKDEKLSAIKKYIQDLSVDPNDSLLISYKPLIENGDFLDIGFDEKNSRYFGNTRGHNNSMDKHTYFQVGCNRQTDINYLILLLLANEDFEMSVRDGYIDVESSIAQFDDLLRHELVDSIMCAELTTDFVQNVFRTKARNIDNTDRIDVYLFYKESDNLMTELQCAFGRLKAKITVDTLEELDLSKILNRKSKTETNAQKIVKWIEVQPKGRKFDIKEFLAETGLSDKNFKVTKKKNPTLQRKFDSMKVGKGKYIIR